MVKKLNPSFVEYFAGYLKKLLADKKKNNETITAVMFQDQVTAAANDYLNKNYGIDAGTARSAIAQSTPEAECANAIKARILHKIQPEPDKRISYYKTQAEISTETSTAAFEDVKTAHPEVANWISKTNMLLYDETANKMRQQPVPFNIETAVKCGNCWICDTDVMSYTGTSTQDHRTEINSPTKFWLSGTTPCGDCEHVSAIMASYIAGMLKSAGFAKFYWASYYVACVECNRKKSNYIGVRLHATRGWEVDADGVEAILNAIFSKNTVKIHESEYNPIRNELTNKYNNMSFAEKEDFRASVRANITSGTKTWCDAANENMNKATATTKHLKMAFNVSKIIVAITGHLKVITGPLEKKAKKRNAESKVVKAARPGAKSTGKRSRGGAPTGSPPLTPEPAPDVKKDVVMVTPTQPTGGPLTQIVTNPGYDTRPIPFPPLTPLKRESDAKVADEKNVVAMKTLETANRDEDHYIMHWNNLLDNDDDDDENGQEDDDENDETKKANKLETENIILTYIGKIYGPRLFEQYKLGLPIIDGDPSIFDDLMENLSTSMNDVLKPIQITPAKIDSKTTTIGPDDGTQTDAAEDSDDAQRKKLSRLNETEPKQFESINPASELPSVGPEEGTQHDEELGGSRLNQHHAKNNSQTHKQKNKTKRVSYIKHKQTRKNKHSKKTKSKRSNKK